jgi:hypothetical protein
MRRNWGVKIFGIALLGLIVIAGFGQAVLQLWNLVMPQVFGLHPITFWQAVGLLALSWILLGRFSGPSFGRRRWRRWEEMTPHQREMLRKGLAKRCGHFENPATDVKA